MEFIKLTRVDKWNEGKSIYINTNCIVAVFEFEFGESKKRQTRVTTNDSGYFDVRESVEEIMAMRGNTMTNAELEQIGQILADHFDDPCNWANIEEYMQRGKGYEWCEKHCGKVTCSECWARFLKGKLLNKGIDIDKSMGENYGFATKEEAELWMNSKPVGKEEI